MATGESWPFGVPENVLMDWKKELKKVDIPGSTAMGASFTHIRCDDSALWMSQFILKELNKRLQAVDDGVLRHLVYALPDSASVDAASDFLRADRDEDRLDLEGTTRILSYAELTAALKTDPHLMRNILVVFDTDFGRASTGLITASTALLNAWALRDECICVAAVVVSPDDDALWPDTYISKSFGSHVTHLALRPARGYSVVSDGRADPDPDPNNRILEAAAQAAVDAWSTRPERSQPAVVACLVPPQQGWQLHGLLTSKLPSGSPFASFVMTADNMRCQLTRVSKLDCSVSVILFVDPSLRFLLPVDGLCRYVLPLARRERWWDPTLTQVVEQDRLFSERDATLAVGLGQARCQSGVRVVYVSDEARLPRLQQCAPAWGRDTAETLLCLTQQLQGGQLVLSDLGVVFGCHLSTIEEALRRLDLMSLIRFVHPAGPDACSTMCVPRDPRVPRWLASGFAASLAEAVLLAEIESAPTDAVKTTLAVVASVFRVGMHRLLQRGSAGHPISSLWDFRLACSGPGAQLLCKGRLWALVGVIPELLRDPAGLHLEEETRPIQGANIVAVNAVWREVHERFAQVLAETAQHNDPPSLPEALEDSEEFAVEVALVTAFLQNLVFVPTGADAVGNVVELVSGVIVSYKVVIRGWGSGLLRHPHHFAIHFGLSKDGPGYTTDSVTLVDTRAVLHVFRRLFPNSPDGEVADYVRLLRTQHPPSC